MKALLMSLASILISSSSIAKPGHIPGGVIPLQGSLTIEIGDLPPLKGGYTIHCKLINNSELRKLYARVLSEGQYEALDIRHGVNVFYFGFEGNKNIKLEFHDYSQLGGHFDPIAVRSCRIHSYPAS